MSLIVVQKGHVPRTSGATGAPGEQQFAIDTAAVLAPMLRSMGHTVRAIDADEPRSRYAGDLFVAIHYDSASSSSASGASVGYQNAAGDRFAQAWKRHYVAEGWTRGFRSDNYTMNLARYYGVSEAIAAGNRTAIITESGFHSNSGDAREMSPTRTARSIALAIGELTNTEVDDMPTAKEIAEAVWEYHLDDVTRKKADGSYVKMFARSFLQWGRRDTRGIYLALPELLDDQGALTKVIRDEVAKVDNGDPAVIEEAFYAALKRVLREGADEEEGTPA